MDVHVSLEGRTDLSGEIYRQLREAILDGRLRPGDRLPATRELAHRLGVSRTTAAVAYDNLALEGFVTARVGAGTFVSGEVVAGPTPGSRVPAEGVLHARPFWRSIRVPTVFDQPAQFDFRCGIPDPSLFPHRAWNRMVGGALRSGCLAGGKYEHPAGLPELRRAVAHHIAIARGVDASPEDVVITSGTQQAIDVLARAMLSPGDRVAVEDPCYPPPCHLLASLGLDVLGVPVDREGLIVDDLPRGVRLVLLTPSHQFPLGVAMSLARRQALLDWAAAHDVAIVEDDYDSEFRFGGRPLDPLQTLDRSGRVVYVGSFSKTMLPALRLAFMVVPPSLRPAVLKAKFVADWHTGTLAQAALARFIDDGSFARHIRKARAAYRARHELISTVLETDFGDRLELVPTHTGLHLTAVARDAAADELAGVAARAAERGVAVQPLAYFGMRPTAPVGLVLGYGAIATPDIEEGLRRLRAAW